MTNKTPDVVAGLGVDTHAHTFTQQLQFVAEGEGYVPDYDASFQSYLDKLKGHGLSHGVLIQPSFLGRDNSHLLASVATNPAALRAIVIVDPDTGEAELAALTQRGVVGVRLILYGQHGEDYASAKWTRFAARLAAVGLLVEVYGPASGLQAACTPFLKAGCRLLIDHFGRPDYSLGERDPGFQFLLGTLDSGKVWIDISGGYRNGPGPAGNDSSVNYFEAIKQRSGLERMLWGSDWPCVQYEATANYGGSVSFLNRVVADSADRHALLWTTPASLFSFSAVSRR